MDGFLDAARFHAAAERAELQVLGEIALEQAAIVPESEFGDKPEPDGFRFEVVQAMACFEPVALPSAQESLDER